MWVHVVDVRVRPSSPGCAAIETSQRLSRVGGAAAGGGAAGRARDAGEGGGGGGGVGGGATVSTPLLLDEAVATGERVSTNSSHCNTKPRASESAPVTRSFSI